MVKYRYNAWGKRKVLDASGVEITDDSHIGVGLLNMVLTLPAVGLSRIVRNSGITNAQSFLFGLVSNAPLIGVSTMGNSLISQISTNFSIGHLKKNIISGILYILETHMKEIIINKKGYYCHAI